MLPVSKTEEYELEKDAKYASQLTVKGTKIYKDNGEQVILKGVMVPELSRLDTEGKFNKTYFDELFEYGVNTIRIPVHPDKWVQDEYYLWRYLDQVVDWAVQHNIYVIIDLHFIGNVLTGTGAEMVDVGQNPYEFSIDFWDTVSNYFKNVPNVIYEIYNEPAQIDATSWSECANKLVTTIRNTGSNQLVIVSGIDYSYDVSYWTSNAIKDSNVVYAAHIFPNRSGSIERFTKLSDTLPIVVTEWGYIAETENAKQAYLIGTRKDYGEPMIRFMKEQEISWIACWYDNEWEPPMFLEDHKATTDWGEFVLNELQ